MVYPARIEKICPVCNYTFSIPPCFSYRIYCSRACSAIGQHLKAEAKNTRIEHICPICGKKEKVTPYRARRLHCSKACASIGIKQKYRDAHPELVKICPVCGTQVRRPPSEVHLVYCSLKCFGVTLRGPRTSEEYQRERRRLKAKRFYARNVARLTPQRKLYHRTHPDIAKKAKLNRRMRQRGTIEYKLTMAQWNEIKAAYGFRCVYCGKKSSRLTQDHITPLFHGGLHTVHNVVPACRKCNCKKHTGNAPVPVQPMLLTVS
jgi:endogenous inhibitor of DNA gyrase (YacG/DUF329 family)